jgi:hypothetical protein
MEAQPRAIVRVLNVFEGVFSERMGDWVLVLVVGAILTPDQRTVAAIVGLTIRQIEQSRIRASRPTEAERAS